MFLYTNFPFLLMQKKLEETQHSLSDLEEKHRQANVTIKEKEFLIYNLLKSGEFLFKNMELLVITYIDYCTLAHQINMMSSSHEVVQSSPLHCWVSSCDYLHYSLG